MDPDRSAERPFPGALVGAALAACTGALLVRHLGVIGLAGTALSALAVCAVRRRFDAVAWAIPAALIALEPEPPRCAWPRPGPIRVDAVVERTLRRDPDGGRVSLLVRQEDVPLRLSIAFDRDEPRILPGDRITGAAFLGDAAEALRRGRIPAAESVLGAVTITPGSGLLRRIEGFRRRLEGELLGRLPGPEGLLVSHLVLGSGPPLPDALHAAHRDSGLAHLLAVSGAHASLLAWMLGAGFRLLRGRDPWQAPTFRRACTLFLLGYGAMTGFEPPVFRALVAWTVVAAGTALGRRPPFATALAAPALGTALLFPDDLLGVSFCLSYAAVVGLHCAGAFRRGSLTDRLTVPLRASYWAMLTTAPLCLLWFGQLAPWTIVGTPLCGPLVAAMLGLGVLTAAFAVTVPPLADLTALALAPLAAVYREAVELLATLPAAPILATEQPPPLVFAGTALLAAALGLAKGGRAGVALACSVACLPFFVPCTPVAPPGLVLHDVGHGQACLLTFDDGDRVLVDCGNLDAPRRAARAVERATLGRRRIDWLIVSHGDFDHVGGIPHLLDRLPITNAVVPAHATGVARTLERAGVRLVRLPPGAACTPRPGLTVHAPDPGAGASENDRSLWVRADLGGVAVLLPGDAEVRGIHAMVESGLATETAVLLLPHHGRGEAEAGRLLLEAVRPRLALVSCGAGAEPPLVAVARALGVPVVTTEERGTIRLSAGLVPELACELPPRVPLDGR